MRAIPSAVEAQEEAEFDPITLEVLWKRMIGIVDVAVAAFVRTCFSTLVRDVNDFAIILADREGWLMASSSLCGSRLAKRPACDTRRMPICSHLEADVDDRT